jgi:predicted TIM-barrel fold metal-dependent hydrolase
MPDNPAFLPIYEMLQKQDRTLVAHLGEPNAAWMPADENNSYSRSYPTWMMYGHAGTPSKEDILTARDRIAARFPKLRVIGCHLGSNEEDLDTLSKRLDRLPNFAVDLAARIRNLVGDREKSRAFLIKYQDRILYGTDFTLGPGGDDQRAWTNLAGTHDRDWRYFSSAEPLTYGRQQVQGLGMPETVLRKIFRDNAVRWLPGIG